MMKRRRLLITGVLLLLGGAIVNVAVAWGFALRLPSYETPRWHFFLLDEKGVAAVVMERFGDMRITAHSDPTSTLRDWYMIENDKEFESLLPSGSRFRDKQWLRKQVLAAPLSARCIILEHLHGWPLLGMSGTMTIDRSNILQPSIVEADGMIKIGAIPFVTAYSSLLPYRLVGPHFFLNTLVYAVILWVMFLVPGIVKRTLRRRRGRCPACAYPIGTSPVCTECGAALR